MSLGRSCHLKVLTDERMDTDARTDDGQKVMTIAHPEHSSGELKKSGYQVNIFLISQHKTYVVGTH